MNLFLPTFSTLPRVMECGGSHLLSRFDRTVEWTSRGQAIQEFIVDARLRGRDMAISTIDPQADHYKFCEAIDFSYFPNGGEMELALAWDHVSDTGRVLGRNLRRRYPKCAPTEYIGAADYCGYREDTDEVVVVDWKTGWVRQGKAEDHWQLRGLALAACRVFRARRARVALVYLREDGSARWSTATFDAFDLAAFAEELRKLARSLARMYRAKVNKGEIPDLRHGHCSRCSGPT
jgi:hypothetical protein